MSVKYQNQRDSIGTKHAFRGRAAVIEVVPYYCIEAVCYPEWSARQPGDLERLLP
jgi:hypothetical protein